MAGGSYLSILRIVGFLSALWSVGKVAKFVGVSSIVFEIAIGLVLSPSMVGLLPAQYAECAAKNHYNCAKDVALSAYTDKDHKLYDLLHHAKPNKQCKTADYLFENGTLQENAMLDCMMKSCEYEVNHHCQVQPNTFTLIGHTGVAMMIFESGMHFDFEKAKVVGPWACVVAVLGTGLPLVAGMLLVMAFGHPLYPDGLAAGVALAPTSVGIALKLLLEAKQLQKDFGQAIITAAFVDDILSLVAFNILFSVTGGDFKFVTSILPALGGIVFLIVGASLGIKFWPWIVEELLSRVPAKSGVASLSRQDEAMLFLMMSVLVAYATFTWWLGTHLWGCFVAGMSFAMIHHAHHIWVRQVKRITVWMLRIFFGATVAFAIPWRDLLSWEAFGYGTIMGLFACILTKVVCAFFMGETRFVIGWAMVGRAEFAYLIAEMAKSGNVMNDKVFSIVIWSLLYATIFAPFCFRKVLQRHADREHEAERKEVEKKISDPDLASNDKLGSLALPHGRESGHEASKIHGEHRGHSTMDGHKWTPTDFTAFRFMILYPRSSSTSIPSCSVEDMSEIWELLLQQGMIVTEMSQQCDKDTHCSVFQVQSKDGAWLEQSDLTYIQNQIFSELKGLGAHVIFLPAMHALQDVCKLAKVTVVADLTGDNPDEKQPSMDGVCKIVQTAVQESFYIVRCGVEMHGHSAVFRLLLGHPKALGALEDDESTAYGSPPDSGKTQSTRNGRQNSATSNADVHADHLHLGVSGLPNIKPEELDQLKTRIENCLDTRICTIIDPLTFAQGPLGEDSHDARTLLMAQGNIPTCEIRFTMDRIHKDFFPSVLDSLSKQGVSLVSARVDERSVCQINCVISSVSLSKEMEEELMNELVRVCEGLGPLNGHIDLSNINTPLDKQYRDIGVTAAPKVFSNEPGAVRT